MDRSRRLLGNPLLHVLGILILGLIVYSNTFHVPFVFDDKHEIVQNPVIRNLGNFFLNSKGYQFNPRRFVAFLTFALNYQWGGLNVSGFHLINLFIHLINGVLVYSLIRAVFRTPFLRSSALADRAHWISLLTAALFLVHPIQTEAVTYIVQRVDSLVTTFYLLSCLLYLKARLFSEEPQREGGWGGAAVFLSYTGALLVAVLAMKTKEIAFTLPIVLALLDFSFFRGNFRKRLLFLVPMLATLSIIPLSLLNLHQPVGQVISDVTKVASVRPTTSRWIYLVTQFCVIVTYIRLLFLPVGQNLDYDYPVYHSLLAWRPLLSFLFLTALVLLALWLWFVSGQFKTQNSKFKNFSGFDPAVRLISFGILWFFISLSVTSSFIPITDLIFEHRVYLPSFGAFAAVATALVLLWTKVRTARFSRAVAAVTVVAIMALGTATFMRNEVWHSKISLWKDAMNKSPGKVRPYNNLGASLSDAGRPDEAIAVLSKALVVDPGHASSYYNLGRVYLEAKNDPDKAIALFRRAIALRPHYDDAFVNLAAALNRARRFQEAAKLLEKKIPAFENRADAHFNLTVSLIYLGQMQAAKEQYLITLRLDPKNAARLARYFR
jgi:tetratricopeptide (TPR) repeat protein